MSWFDAQQLAQLLAPSSMATLVETALTLALAFAIGVVMLPGLIRRMRQGGMVGKDVNKPGRPEIPELGGIAALFSFSISISMIVGLNKLIGSISEPPYLAAVSAFFIAAMVGLIDDISTIPQRLKAIGVAFAALPLMLVHIGAVVSLPFDGTVALDGPTYFLYWLVLVPVGVSGVANAMNMSAGYNGLESGQIAIASSAILVVLFLRGGPEHAILIIGALAGAALGLYVFNRYPSKVFVGDIGTLGMGAALASAIILGHVEVYGLIAIIPAFYEAFATAYYSLRRDAPDRRQACHNPIIRPDGTLQPPRGAERYTLAYLLLSRHPMTERQLNRKLLGLYALCGAVAILLSVL